MNPLVAEIRRLGRVSFERFMELALYDPEAGYYTRARRGPGPAGSGGDFITAPTASPLLARTLAGLLGRLAREVGEPLTFAELAAGEGFLLSRLLEELGGVGGPVLRQAVAVEAGEWARRRIRRACPEVTVAERLSDLPHPNGATVLFASELYDAVPARRVTLRRRDGALELAEFYVTCSPGGRLRWLLDTPADDAPASYFAAHGVSLEEGQVAEFRPGVETLHAGHLAWCGRSAVALVVDYGYPARQLYNPRARRHGSLVGYRGHTLVENVLARPGRIDLTAHVNLDDLYNAGLALGWERADLRPLGSFLALHGVLDLLPAAVRSGGDLASSDWAELAAAKRLLSPAGMGGDLKVLVQGKGPAWGAYLKLATPPPAEA